MRLLTAAMIWLLALFVAGLATPGETAETGDLPALRQQALDFVNAARQERNLLPLKLADRLNDAAQAHAEDMLRRDYYSHVSPEGETVMDRYVARGGDASRLVAENIATCAPCAGPPDAARVKRLLEGWMDSPEHRDNILRRGLTRFGFGIAAGAEGPLYAVQTFAGPGTSRGTDSRQTAEPLAPGEAGELFARRANARREEASLPPLEPSPALSIVAERLLPAGAADTLNLQAKNGPMDALPPEAQGDWQALSVLAGSCGGCGAEPTTADIRFFMEMWLDDAQQSARLLGRGPTNLGFALRAYGDGRKVAIAVLGTRR